MLRQVASTALIVVSVTACDRSELSSELLEEASDEVDRDQVRAPADALVLDASVHDGQGGEVEFGEQRRGFPCQIATILSQHCSGCHGETPRFGAPLALTEPSHFLAQAQGDAGRKVYELVSTRINAADPSRRMPPPSSKPLSGAELEAINAWLTAGAPLSSERCSVDTSQSVPDATPKAGGSGGVSTEPIAYDDPALTCYTLTARSESDRDQPYSVPTTPDLYIDFTMSPPWSGTRYVRSFRSIVENEQAIHHLILYKHLTALDEAVQPGIGMHPDAQGLFGWSPGSSNLYFDPDVGMKVEGDVSYTLEVHYNNTTGRPAPDASGVEVCVTPTPPIHEVAESWLGTEYIFGETEVSGECTPSNTEPVHIIAAHPHMHKKGRHMKVVLERANGRRETVFDEPFSFEYQRHYQLDLLVYPGDRLTTTCSYSEPAIFGPGVNDEMCFFFPLAWPAGALVNQDDWFSLHGPNVCLQ